MPVITWLGSYEVLIVPKALVESAAQRILVHRIPQVLSQFVTSFQSIFGEGFNASVATLPAICSEIVRAQTSTLDDK